MSSSAEAHGEEHRALGLQEETGDTQVRQVRQVLSVADFPEEASETRVRRGAPPELSDLRQKVHAQVQTYAPRGLVPKKTNIIEDHRKRRRREQDIRA